MPGTRKLGRATDSRKAMLRAMVTYLFENGKIETTVPRAKEVRSMAEKMITLSKAGDLHDKRQIFSYITKEDVAKKVIDVYGAKYADRNRRLHPHHPHRRAPRRCCRDRHPRAGLSQFCGNRTKNRSVPAGVRSCFFSYAVFNDLARQPRSNG